jgi:SAM-dependent methyltransferase
VGRYAKDDIAHYQLMMDFLADRNLSTPNIKGKRSMYELLEAINAHYEVEGMQSLYKIPDRSVDFIWSQAVLEHIKREEFIETLRELHRILRKDGVCSHRVDLKDHLGGGLNNLRFSTAFWESDFMSQSGFYTNRIRFKEMLKLFEVAGFDVMVLQIDRWSQLPTPRKKLSVDFRHLPEDDLSVSGFDVVLAPH